MCAFVYVLLFALVVRVRIFMRVVVCMSVMLVRALFCACVVMCVRALCACVRALLCALGCVVVCVCCSVRCCVRACVDVCFVVRWLKLEHPRVIPYSYDWTAQNTCLRSSHWVGGCVNISHSVYGFHDYKSITKQTILTQTVHVAVDL